MDGDPSPAKLLSLLSLCFCVWVVNTSRTRKVAGKGEASASRKGDDLFVRGKELHDRKTSPFDEIY